MTGEHSLADVVERLEKLENAVFAGGKKAVSQGSKHSGLVGGLRLLVDEGFFAQKRTAAEAKSELEGKDYHYRTSAIQTAMNRLAVKTGSLTAFSEGGKKIYVRRK